MNVLGLISTDSIYGIMSITTGNNLDLKHNNHVDGNYGH